MSVGIRCTCALELIMTFERKVAGPEYIRQVWSRSSQYIELSAPNSQSPDFVIVGNCDGKADAPSCR